MPAPPAPALYKFRKSAARRGSNLAAVAELTGDSEVPADSSVSSPSSSSAVVETTTTTTSTTTTEAPIPTTTTTTTTTSTTTSTTTTTSAPSNSISVPSGTIIGAVVGSVVGALVVGLAIGLVCTYCAFCRRCGGGCRATPAARNPSSDSEEDSGGTYATSESQLDTSTELKRSFTRTREAIRRNKRIRRQRQRGSSDEKSDSSVGTATSKSTTPRSHSSSRSDSESDSSDSDRDDEGDNTNSDVSFASTDIGSSAAGVAAANPRGVVGQGGTQNRGRHRHEAHDVMQDNMVDVVMADAGEDAEGEAVAGDTQQRLGSLQTLPGYPAGDSWGNGGYTSLHAADLTALLDDADADNGHCNNGGHADGDAHSAGSTFSQSDRSMLTEANVALLHSDDDTARLQAVNSIRYHQSQGMSEDASVLLHLYRHRSTSDPAFGTFLDDQVDVNSD